MMELKNNVKNALNSAIAANVDIRETYTQCDNALAEIILFELMEESAMMVRKLERLSAALGE